MFETKGRKASAAYVGGKLYMVKKPIHLKANGAVVIQLPKDWMRLVELTQPVKYFLLDITDARITIIPHYGDLELGEF